MVDGRTDYKQAYTLQFVNHGVGVDLRPKRGVVGRDTRVKANHGGC